MSSVLNVIFTFHCGDTNLATFDRQVQVLSPAVNRYMPILEGMATSLLDSNPSIMDHPEYDADTIQTKIHVTHVD